MKNINLIIPAAMLVLASCSQAVNSSSQNNQADSLAQNASNRDSLSATMQIQPVIKANAPVTLTFTVKNESDSPKTFCKWHTPFEPFISKYLDIKDMDGNEIAYKGAMAKRVMPPPADSYITVKTNDSTSVSVDLLKGYDILPGKSYTVNYVGSGLSGLKVNQPVTFRYEN